MGILSDQMVVHRAVLELDMLAPESQYRSQIVLAHSQLTIMLPLPYNPLKRAQPGIFHPQQRDTRHIGKEPFKRFRYLLGRAHVDEPIFIVEL